MKTKILLLAIGAIIIATGAKAQKGIDNGTPYGSGADSIRCRENTSLYVPYYSSKNYKDAYPFWKAVYEECPASNENVYIAGVTIITWQISEESDPAKKEALVNDMMKLYDDRIKYFGSGPQAKNRKDWIIARKVQTYNKLKSENSDYQLMYKWTGEAIEEFKETTEPLAIMLYMYSSLKLMQNDMDKHKAQYVDDFLKCSEILETQLTAAEAAGKEKEREDIIAQKRDVEQNFTASGAAECDILQSIYDPRVEENKDNLEFLDATMKTLRRVQCEESDVYIKAAKYAYKIQPTSDAAMGLGVEAFKNNDFVMGEKYFLEAIEMSDNSDKKGRLYWVLMVHANQQNQYVKTKQYFQKCIGETPDNGQAYILMGQAYAAGGRNLFPDDQVKAKCLYYAVVDKFERAKQVDKSVTEEANKLINTYKKYFPTKEEVFMHPDLNAGDNFNLGGWVGETVRIRHD